ncbi:MAG: hypothetical protein IJO05_01010 [Oscillospiraceae bacterium]|nr:hypothetical protein [Oscillospiraceae bacterium]
MDSFKMALTILLALILAADAVVFWQVRRLIHRWDKEIGEEDKVLTDEEQRYVEVRMKLLGFLSTTALGLFLLRFVVFELIPLIGG